MYKKAVIRVHFVDQVVLQGVFHPDERISDVQEWLRSCFCEEAQAVPFFLFTRYFTACVLGDCLACPLLVCFKAHYKAALYKSQTRA